MEEVRGLLVVSSVVGLCSGVGVDEIIIREAELVMEVVKVLNCELALTLVLVVVVDEGRRDGVGVVTDGWLIMEEKHSPALQSGLTARTLSHNQ